MRRANSVREVAEVIYNSNLGTAYFDRRGVTVPFDHLDRGERGPWLRAAERAIRAYNDGKPAPRKRKGGGK